MTVLYIEYGRGVGRVGDMLVNIASYSRNMLTMGS